MGASTLVWRQRVSNLSDLSQLPGFSIALAIVCLVALVLAVVNTMRLSRVDRRFPWLANPESTSVDSLAALLRTVEANARDITEVKNMVGEVVSDGRQHFKHVGLVRYDAFDGLAGQQSYSLCLLDDDHNGVLLSSLVGNNFNRSYAVEIKEGSAQRKLGDEETKALAVAVSGRS